MRLPVTVSDEVLRDNYPMTLESIMAAQRRAYLARLNRWDDERLFGAHLNPCIILGETDVR